MKKGKAAVDLTAITLATALIAASVYFFIIPSAIPLGSISGLALILSNLLPLSISEVVYCETVEEKTFVYTESGIYQTALTLAELEERWAATGLLRCGKSCVVNLYAIRRLRSCGAGRIEAALTTGEKIMISRHYAPALREKLGMR